MSKQLSSKATAAGYSVERHESHRSYPKNGNVLNPTITYTYTVKLNGKPMAAGLAKRGEAVQFAEDCASGAL